MTDYKNYEGYLQLNDNQKRAFEAMAEGKDVFITGVAGTGKSFVINTFNRWARMEAEKNVVVVAPTGLAAYLVDGVTLHSQFYLSGVQTEYFNYSQYVSRLNQKAKRCLETLHSMDILEIEEISMVRYDYFRRVMKILDAERENFSRQGKPHRIQRILSGDFGQLCPILKSNTYQSNKGVSKNNNKLLTEQEAFFKEYPGLQEQQHDIADRFKSPETWAFLDIDHWYRFEVVELTEVIRQSDKYFVNALNQVRLGDVNGLKYINNHRAEKIDNEAVVLCGTNKDVQMINDMCLSDLEGEEYTSTLQVFTGKDMAKRDYEKKLEALSDKLENGEINEAYFKVALKNIKEDRDKAIRRCEMYAKDIEIDLTQVPADRILRIKKGAKVMVLINDKGEDKRFRNGSFGEVTSFTTNEDDEVDSVTVRLSNGDVIKFTKYDWKQKAYIVETDEKAMETDEGYEYKGHIYNKKSVKEEMQISSCTETEACEILGTNEDWIGIVEGYEAPKGRLKEIEVGCITGIPLRLRYAMTVHKSQGHTFDSVALLPKFWDYGQLYTALSRVKSLEGLYYEKPISYRILKTSPLVKDFYRELHEHQNEKQFETAIEESSRTKKKYDLSNMNF